MPSLGSTQFISQHPPPGDTHILVVDDEPTLRMGFRLALLTEGYQVEIAGNGEDALRHLQHAPIGVMILDLRMPGLDGIGVLKRLAMDQIMVPSIVCSAHMDVAVVLEALRWGAVDFLSKPVRPNELREIAQRVLHEEFCFQSGPEWPLPAVNRARCLLRRRRAQEALELLQSAELSPAEQSAATLWTRVAESVLTADDPASSPAPSVPLRELINWWSRERED